MHALRLSFKIIWSNISLPALLVASLLAMASPTLWAANACSPSMGKATLNEYNHQGNFVEVKTLVAGTSLSGWSIRIYSSSSSSNSRPLNDPANQVCTKYEVVTFGSSQTPPDADVVLFDSAGDVVDILRGRTGGSITAFYSMPSCNYVGPSTDLTGVLNSNKGIDRQPDGTGAWRNTPGTGAGSFQTACAGNAANTSSNVNLVMSKTVSPATVALNGNATFTLTVGNSGPNTGVRVQVADTLPVGLSYVSNTAPTAGTFDPLYFLWDIPNLANGASASMTITVSGTSAGTFTNTAVVASDNNETNIANNTATAALTVLNPPTVTKSFNASAIGVNGTSVQTITLTNPNATAITGAAFTDTYPANMRNTSSAAGATTCAGGTVTAANAGGSVALGGGTIPANGSCTVTVNVTSATSGSYLNSTGTVTTTNAGSGTSASATLTVLPSVSIASASAVEGNAGTTAMTFTITQSALSSLASTVTYAASNGTAIGGTCGVAGVDYATTTGTATIPAGSISTTFTVNVCGETSYEGDESFTVTLSSPVNATLGTSIATGTILNDDPPPLVAEYHFDETVWSGASGEVKDSSANGYHATAAMAATASGTPGPAYTVGGQNTCRYGVFDGGAISKSYVQLPGAFPGLSGSFSLTAWINSSNATAQHQRIFVRDDADNGWALSLADGTGTGILRFFNRNVTFTSPTGGSVSAGGVAIDTAFRLSSNTWYFVALTVDTVGKTAVMYAYDTAGAQKSKMSASFTGTWGAGTGATSIGGETAASSEGQQTSWHFLGRIDEVRIFSGALTQTLVEALLPTVRPCVAVDHVRIEHDGQGLTCQSETLTVKACADADAGSPATCTAYTSGISGNVLVKNGATVLATVPFTIASGSSSTTVSAAVAAAPNVTFETNALSVTPSGASAWTCWNSATTTASCSMAVGACVGGSNFNCLDSSITPYTSGTARLYTKLADTAFNFDVVALNASGAQEANYVVGTGATRQVTVELFNNTTPAATCSAYSSPIASQTLTFGATDAGRKQIANVTLAPAYSKLMCRVTDTTVSPAVYGCSSDDFSVRPSAATIVTAAIATAPSATASPAIKTGANFSLSATTSAGTGYAGSMTLDVSKLTAQNPAQVVSQQIGGAVGSLTPNALVANAAAVNATYSEVGYLYLAPGAYRDEAFTAVDSAFGDCITSTASDNNLADTMIGGKFGCHIGNKTAVSMGRFIPDHFDVSVNSNGSLAGACLAGGFTYTGQPMGYGTAPSLTIKPMNAASGGSVTQNYRVAFQKLAAADVAITAPTADATRLGVDATNKTLLSASMTTGTLVNSSGTMTYTLNAGDQFTYTRNANAMVAAYTNTIPLIATAVAEAEVSAAGSLVPLPQTMSPTGVSLRYGRARMLNAYGSELLDLPVVFKTEYLSSVIPNQVWSLNSADSCTNTSVAFVSKSTVDITTHTCVLEPGNNSGKGCAVALSSAQTNRRYLESGVTGIDSGGIAGFAGNFNLWLKAPGNTRAGSIDITATVDSWLQYPWSGSTPTNPVARATFGVYKSPLIYRRENY